MNLPDRGCWLRSVALALLQQEVGEVKDNRLLVPFTVVILNTGAIHHSLSRG